MIALFIDVKTSVFCARSCQKDFGPPPHWRRFNNCALAELEVDRFFCAMGTHQLVVCLIEGPITGIESYKPPKQAKGGRKHKKALAIRVTDTHYVVTCNHSPSTKATIQLFVFIHHQYF